MIKQIHFTECDSTQDELKEQLGLHPGASLLVSCDHQKNGRGRGENKWNSLAGTLCFSLTVTPSPVVSFTALEISLLVLRFFSEKGRTLKLKWPNDLWDQKGKKCGGILIQGLQNSYLAGIGLNIFTDDAEYGSIYADEFHFSREQMAKDLATFIHSHRYESVTELKADWEAHCGHLNQRVRVTENDNICEGQFLGLGHHGEALVESQGVIKNLYNGSLRLT